MNIITIAILIAASITTAISVNLLIRIIQFYKIFEFSANRKRYNYQLNSKERILKTNFYRKYYDRININIFQKSNIRKRLPFMNMKLLFCFALLLNTITFIIMYSITQFFTFSFLIGVCSSILPYIILDLLAQKNEIRAREMLGSFVSVLNRWSGVKNDFVFALCKSAESSLGDPLDKYIKETVTRIKFGMNVSEALDLLSHKIDSVHFRTLIINLIQNIKHRGDLSKLLTSIEDQMFKMEEEFNRRKVSTLKDRFAIYFVMISVLVASFIIFIQNIEMKEFYFENYPGKVLINIFILLYLIGVYMTIKINKFNY